ncbi:hypothetical protein J1614_004165 [Plenodomus biglobosus]|nr:hypothetical protein J1614_004165 [Plenodomus biglobosus]
MGAGTRSRRMRPGNGAQGARGKEQKMVRWAGASKARRWKVEDWWDAGVRGVEGRAVGGAEARRAVRIVVVGGGGGGVAAAAAAEW